MVANKKTSKRKGKVAIKTSHDISVDLETVSQYTWTGLDAMVQGMNHMITGISSHCGSAWAAIPPSNLVNFRVIST
jgi:hypothetical protein